MVKFLKNFFGAFFIITFLAIVIIGGGYLTYYFLSMVISTWLSVLFGIIMGIILCISLGFALHEV